MIRKVILTAILAIATCSLAFEPFKFNGLDTALPQQRPQAVALEEPIDRDSYILGPGDILEFSVWGSIEFHHIVEVAPDGSILIPSVGDLSVAGMTLAEVEKSVVTLAKPMYAKSKLSIRIIAVRRMKVSISGSGFQTGIITVSSIDRLSTVLALAAKPLSADMESGGVISMPDEAEVGKSTKAERWATFEDYTEALPSLRKISITDRTGSEKVVDFLRFQRTGDRNSNPVLKDGDRIHIPPMTDSTDVVHVLGGVMLPDRYEYIVGDRLRDLIDLAGGFRSSADLNTITIFRSNSSEPGIKSQSIVVSISEKDSDRGPKLLSGDRILVRTKSDADKKAFVKVSGEAAHPGIYPIDNLVTTLRELILKNGGFSENADLKNAKLIRWSTANMADPEFNRLENLSVVEMSKMEYEYYKVRSRKDLPTVVVDFNDLFSENPKISDIPLIDGDEVVIPLMSPMVFVAGHVKMPGLVKFVEGKDYAYYIEQAGGYAWNAHKKKQRLLKAETNRWIKLDDDDAVIEVGDTIFVPEKKERDYWVLMKELLLVASQIATLIIVLRTI